MSEPAPTPSFDPAGAENAGPAGEHDPASNPPAELSEPDSANREAAKFRTKLREAEAQRTGLAERIERMQRAEVVRHAADRLAVAADLFDVGGITVADLVNDDGDVDSTRVNAAVDDLIERRPGLAKDAARPQRRGPSTAGMGTSPHAAAGGPSWADVMRPGR